METIEQNNITLDSVEMDVCLQTSVLRLDKIHSQVSGNKWFKLKYHLDAALKAGKNTIITYGGAYSNHIIATAVACKMFGFKSIGIIRGERPKQISHTLQDALNYGMELHFISRTDYRNKIVPEGLNTDHAFIVNEGGCGELGAMGFKDIEMDTSQFDFTICSVGTGTMMAGLINAGFKNLIGISVMKNNFELNEIVAKLTHQQLKEINILHNFHHGGYAKYTPELIDFMNDFYNKTKIPTDFVYSGKTVFAAHQLMQQKYFPEGSKVLIIHCGGLQGNLSLPNGTLIF